MGSAGRNTRSFVSDVRRAVTCTTCSAPAALGVSVEKSDVPQSITTLGLVAAPVMPVVLVTTAVFGPPRWRARR